MVSGELGITDIGMMGIGGLFERKSKGSGQHFVCISVIHRLRMGRRACVAVEPPVYAFGVGRVSRVDCHRDGGGSTSACCAISESVHAKSFGGRLGAPGSRFAMIDHRIIRTRPDRATHYARRRAWRRDAQAVGRAAPASHKVMYGALACMRVGQAQLRRPQPQHYHRHWYKTT